MVKDRIKKAAIFTGKLLISAGLLWFVFSKIDIRSITAIIKSAHVGWLMAAFLLFVLSKLVSAYRLNLFFRATGLIMPEGFNIKLYLLGMFYNLFLPGGIGGDAYKIIILNRNSAAKLKHIFQATLLDRVTGLTALLVITIILSWGLSVPPPVHLLSALSVPVIISASFFIIRLLFPLFVKIFIRTNLQSALVQTLQLASALCILNSFGHTGETLLLLTLFLVSSVMSVIPLTFGGAGAREFTFAVAGTLLTLSEETREAAIALGLVFYIITAITSLAGAWYLLFPLKIPDVTRVVK